jgi:uncharacterized protein with NRDE domain
MCLITFALDAHPDVRLVFAANRDEAYARPTAPAAFWTEPSGATWFGGRDVEKGGTWLALSNDASRLAAVTNVRAPGVRRDGKSRGWLVRDAALSGDPVDVYARAIDRPAFPAFNLLLADAHGMFYARDDAGVVERIANGVHGLSNDRLDVSWPKVERVKNRLRALLDVPATPSAGALFDLLADEAPADDARLPSTGVSLEVERALSPAFIRTPTYGTRSSTVVLWHRSGALAFEERSFDASGALLATIAQKWP